MSTIQLGIQSRHRQTHGIGVITVLVICFMAGLTTLSIVKEVQNDSKSSEIDTKLADLTMVKTRIIEAQEQEIEAQKLRLKSLEEKNIQLTERVSNMEREVLEKKTEVPEYTNEKIPAEHPELNDAKRLSVEENYVGLVAEVLPMNSGLDTNKMKELVRLITRESIHEEVITPKEQISEMLTIALSGPSDIKKLNLIIQL